MRLPAPDSINVLTWLSLRFERGTHYYQLHMEQDLWGAWMANAGEWQKEFAARPSANDLTRLV